MTQRTKPNAPPLIPEPGDHAADWRDQDGRWHYADCGACRPEGCCCCCPTPDDQP